MIFSAQSEKKSFSLELFFSAMKPPYVYELSVLLHPPDLSKMNASFQ